MGLHTFEDYPTRQLGIAESDIARIERHPNADIATCVLYNGRRITYTGYDVVMADKPYYLGQIADAVFAGNRLLIVARQRGYLPNR